MTSNKNVIFNNYKLPIPLHIILPEGQNVQMEEAGMVHAARGLILKDVLYTSTFAYNLISVSQLTRHKYCIVTYGANFCLT